jgi:hypothetical protein
MSKDYETLCATTEAFDYVAMTMLMVRRLARAQDLSDRFSRHFVNSTSWNEPLIVVARNKRSGT